MKNKNEEIREKVIDYHRKTRKTHIGSSLSTVEILTSLYYDVMKEDDRFILSKGHGSSALYVVLNDLGIIPDEKMDNLEIHPKYNEEQGIYASTGSLGHGLSIGLGLSLAMKTKLKFFADCYVRNSGRVFVLLGDGELDEGQNWEAIRDAVDYKANNLTAIIDCNRFQGFKKTNYKTLEKKFKAFGWETAKCNGHNMIELEERLKSQNKKPKVVFAETIKGKGLDVEGTLKSHYYNLK